MLEIAKVTRRRTRPQFAKAKDARFGLKANGLTALESNDKADGSFTESSGLRPIEGIVLA